MENEMKYVIFGSGAVYSTFDFLRFEFVRGDAIDYPEAEEVDSVYDIDDYAEMHGKNIIKEGDIYILTSREVD